MRRACLSLVACTLVAAGCGGGNDREDIDETLSAFVKALNTRDGDTFCEELVTKEFVEKQTFAKGDKAIAACKKELAQVKGLTVKLVKVSSVKVDGDTARVRAVLSVQSQEQDQVYRLRKEDGDWRIASGAGG
jgi:ketosteroid isomerase-like protein